MNNIDRAAIVVAQTTSYGEAPVDECDMEVAQALADAGLLAPELPAPEPADDGALTWAAGNVWVEDDEGIVYTEFPRRWSMLSPHGARELAHALLAAADYSEEQA